MNVEKIKKYLWEPYTQYLNCIELRGSQTLSFLQNKRDIDLVLFCKNEDCIKIIRQIFKQYIKDYKQKYNWCIHIDIDNEYSLSITYPIFRYGTIFSTQLFGKTAIDKYDIINNSAVHFKEISFCVDQFVKTWQFNTLFTDKIWYNIYINMCILKNNSYTFTKEQQENIQWLHDRNINDHYKQFKLIKECLDYFNIDSINFEKQYTIMYKNEEK